MTKMNLKKKTLKNYCSIRFPNVFREENDAGSGRGAEVIMPQQ